jgi:Cu(I)/Ag(I) efflux system periplasmic protein CusF
MPSRTIQQSNLSHPKEKEHTMKMPSLLFAIALLAGCSQAPGNAGDSDTSGTGNAPAAEPAPMANASPAMATAAKQASATGTVEAVDTAAGKITIAHGAVEALQWPAMTMGFKATPEQAASVQVGQQVQFEFESQGMDATITQITPVE